MVNSKLINSIIDKRELPYDPGLFIHLDLPKVLVPWIKVAIQSNIGLGWC